MYLLAVCLFVCIILLFVDPLVAVGFAFVVIFSCLLRILYVLKVISKELHLKRKDQVEQAYENYVEEVKGLNELKKRNS
ncbi:hypothetical protein [Halalkalibacter hemicellulosilyticus]|uniref:Uncharacterized protein n=1 Tax=Halalkalibacter hemicellulosilyticusJCM 9152 TaxID=1236971 RepID=W4QJB1_9BACI|nr:hypothetical protein [Halalkalibacter hemicellulosilyticus]GAE32210.1 hypothetical protein JCM9152_3734 [Halalkalibacter hemicellulosilyticusJCM 9152]